MTSFRQATPEDAQLLTDMENVCFHDPWNFNMVFSELLEPASTYWILLDDEGTPSGYVGYYHVLDEMHIMNVAVMPDKRRRGYGSLIIKRLLTEAYANKINAVTLEVRSGNVGARKLYEKFGFVCAGIRPHYYMDGEDAAIYWLRLGG